MKDCLFCKIVRKEIPSQIEVETASLLAFKNISPRASVHLLIVPKQHLKDISEDDGVVWASIGKLVVKIAKEKKLNGFRLVHNAGSAAAVAHMHVHFLGEVSAEREV